MGKIIKNGVPYGGSSTSAGNVSYDNTSTGLQSTTVQNAIAELKTLQNGNISFSIVNELPSAASAETNIIYLIDTNNNNMFEMWAIVIKNNTKTWAALGETSIDINDLVGKKEYVNNELKGEIFNTYTGNSKNVASGLNSHAEGYNATASGADSHAEGCLTTASGAFSHAGGIGTIANSEASMAIGKYNTPDTQILPPSEDSSDSSDSSDSDSSDSDLPSIQHLFIIGNGTDDSHRSNIVEVTRDTFNVNGNITVAGQNLIIQCDSMPTADEDILGRIVQYVGDTDNDYIHGYFYECVSDEEEPPTYSWEEKVISPQLDQVGHFEYDQYGNITGEIFNTYTGNDKNIASSSGSHAEGNGTTASSSGSHAEGNGTTASGLDSHAEGNGTIASGNYGSHAEGSNTVASGDHSHAENNQTTASNYSAHAEGSGTVASGYASHAEGAGTAASGKCSHAGGYHTEAKTDYSTVIGKYNRVDGTDVSDPKHLFIIGNGASNYTPSNIVEVSETYMNINGDIQKNGVSLPTPYTTMPTITSDMLRQIAMYVGETTNNYVKGHFYIASSDGAAEPIYSWTEVSFEQSGYAWAGTSAQWSQLSTAQKAEFDGKEILITDDVGSGQAFQTLDNRVTVLEDSYCCEGSNIGIYRQGGIVTATGMMDVSVAFNATTYGNKCQYIVEVPSAVKPINYTASVVSAGDPRLYVPITIYNLDTNPVTLITSREGAIVTDTKIIIDWDKMTNTISENTNVRILLNATWRADGSVFKHYIDISEDEPN